MHDHRWPALSLLAAFALVGCAKDAGHYPSLAKRPAERITAVYGAPQNEPAADALPLPSGAVTNRLGALVAQAQRGDARFRRGEPTARQLVGGAGRSQPGTEAWSLATMAVSELEAARGETMVPLAELDRLFAETVTQGQDATTIDSAREQVIAIVGRQDAVLSQLRGRLGN